MRTDNIKVTMTIPIPYDQPDDEMLKNGFLIKKKKHLKMA